MHGFVAALNNITNQYDRCEDVDECTDPLSPFPCWEDKVANVKAICDNTPGKRSIDLDDQGP